MMVSFTKYLLSNCIILSVISLGVIAQISQSLKLNSCRSKYTCHECIQTPSCAWCMNRDFKGGYRCFKPYEDISFNMCGEEFVYNPENLYMVENNLQLGRVGVGENNQQYNESMSEYMNTSGEPREHQGGEGLGRVVQVAPQKLNQKLRARERYRFGMKYLQAQGYPIDLYYLVDFSKSMDENKLYTLGNQLVHTMKNLTSNFRLGFGSLKPVKPCDQCQTFYEFHHHVTLSNNTDKFLDMVKQANVSGNIAAPGGFDAMIQAIVCKNHIGWRDEARKFLVFASDATFHFTKDRKCNATLKPNDGYCHLSTEGIYNEYCYQDYPSIEQANVSLKKNFINVIFAVNESTISTYEQFARNIEGASVGKLDGESSNVVELIREQYQQIYYTVEMNHNASSAVSLKFYNRCNPSEDVAKTKKCGNVKLGDIVRFMIDLELVMCPKDSADYFQTIRIHPIGIDASLIIDLEMMCECNCEKPGHRFYEVNSTSCSGHGTSKCGICECEPGTHGKNCECAAETRSDFTKTDCIDTKNTYDLECSGRGQCVCGHCVCDRRTNENEVIDGRYCECDNFSCERRRAKLCSGHGKCECGVCHCNKRWTGSDCACKKSKANCYPPGSDNTIECSGHGVCKCGQCVCDYTQEGMYTGRFCERIPFDPQSSNITSL